MNEILLNNQKARMVQMIQTMYKRINSNKEVLRMDLVKQDLNDLERQIARTLSRMGY